MMTRGSEVDVSSQCDLVMTMCGSEVDASS